MERVFSETENKAAVISIFEGSQKGEIKERREDLWRAGRNTSGGLSVCVFSNVRVASSLHADGPVFPHMARAVTAVQLRTLCERHKILFLWRLNVRNELVLTSDIIHFPLLLTGSRHDVKSIAAPTSEYDISGLSRHRT